MRLACRAQIVPHEIRLRQTCPTGPDRMAEQEPKGFEGGLRAPRCLKVKITELRAGDFGLLRLHVEAIPSASLNWTKLAPTPVYPVRGWKLSRFAVKSKHFLDADEKYYQFVTSPESMPGRRSGSSHPTTSAEKTRTRSFPPRSRTASTNLKPASTNRRVTLSF